MAFTHVSVGFGGVRACAFEMPCVYFVRAVGGFVFFKRNFSTFHGAGLEVGVCLRVSVLKGVFAGRGSAQGKEGSVQGNVGRKTQMPSGSSVLHFWFWGLVHVCVCVRA